MPRSGIVVKFDREKGFGFIRFSKGEEDVFVHISDVQGRVELVPGQNVECDVVHTEKGLAARNVVPGSMAASPFGIFLVVALLIVGLAIAGAMLLSWRPIIGALVGINLATFVLFGYDKSIAGGRKLRVPEALLLLLTFLGGTPAALVARPYFRHKTRKTSFRLAFWGVIALQVALFVGWAWCYDHHPAWIPESLRVLFPGPRPWPKA